MSPEVRQRMEVYRAIALRDAAGMHRLAARMLDGEAIKGFAWAKFLLTTAMLGAQASGRGDEARRLWRSHAAALYPDGRMPAEVVYVANWQG
jgi:hypothetical protein